MCFQSYFCFTCLFRMKKSLEPGQGFKLATFHFIDKCNGLFSEKPGHLPEVDDEPAEADGHRRHQDPPQLGRDARGIALLWHQRCHQVISLPLIRCTCWNLNSMSHSSICLLERRLEKLPFKVADVSCAREVRGSKRSHPMSPTCR